MIQQIFGPKKYKYARQHTLPVSVLNLVSRDVDVLRHVPFVLFNLMKLVKLLDLINKSENSETSGPSKNSDRIRSSKTFCNLEFVFFQLVNHSEGSIGSQPEKVPTCLGALQGILL